MNVGVCKSTLAAWEQNRREVGLRQIPRVVAFLGYGPFPEPGNLGERIRLYRKLNGISRRELAQRLGPDETTVWRWEAGRGGPSRRLSNKLGRFFEE